MPNPRGSSRDTMVAQETGQGPLGGERLIDYNIFLTDAFSGSAGLKDQFVGSDGTLLENDDSYRTSRHLLNNGRAREGNTASIDNIRESSLARQLQTKDESVATIRLIRRLSAEEKAQRRSTEDHLPWVNLIPPNTKFFLQSVQENREEKVQVVDTFGEWVAFFFGRKPEVYSYSGTLLNAQNHDWKNEFQLNYDMFLRGSQAVKHKATVMLQYDDVIVEGYMLNNSIQMSSVADNSVPFSFNLLVVNRSPVNARNIIGQRLDRSGGTLLEKAIYQDLNEALNLSNTGRLDDLETFFLMREYFSGNYIPGAGTATHRPSTGTLDSETTTTPGEKGGLTNAKKEPAAFVNSYTNSMEANGVSGGKLAQVFA